MQRMILLLCMLLMIIPVVSGASSIPTAKIKNIQYIQNLPGTKAFVADHNLNKSLISEESLNSSKFEEIIGIQFDSFIPDYKIRKMRNRIYLEFSNTVSKLMNSQLLIMKSSVKKITTVTTSPKTVITIDLLKDCPVYDEINGNVLRLGLGGEILESSKLMEDLQRLKKKVEEKYILKDDIPEYLKTNVMGNFDSPQISPEEKSVFDAPHKPVSSMDDLYALFGKNPEPQKEINSVEKMENETFRYKSEEMKTPYDEISSDENINQELYARLKNSCRFDRFIGSNENSEKIFVKIEETELTDEELNAFDSQMKSLETIVEETKEIKEIPIADNAKDETVKLFQQVKMELQEQEKTLPVIKNNSDPLEGSVEVLSYNPLNTTLGETDKESISKLVDVAINAMAGGQRVTLILNDRTDFREISTDNQYILILKDCLKGKQLKNDLVEVQKMPLGNVRLVESGKDLKVIFSLTGQSQPVVVREANRFLIEFKSVEPKKIDFSKGESLHKYIKENENKYTQVMDTYHKQVEKKLAISEGLSEEEKGAFSELMEIYEEEVLKTSLKNAEEISVKRKNAVLTLNDIKYLNFKTGLSQLLFLFNKNADYHLITTDNQIIIDIKNCETNIDPSTIQYYHPIRFIRKLVKGDILRFILVTGAPIVTKTEKKDTSLIINLYEKDYFNLESIRKEQLQVSNKPVKPLTENRIHVEDMPYPDSKKLDLILENNKKGMPVEKKDDDEGKIWLLEKPRTVDVHSEEGVGSEKLKLAMDSAKSKSDANKHFLAGKAYEQHEDYVSAYNEYESALNLVPNDLNVIRALNAVTSKRDMQQYWLDGNRHLDHEDYYKAIYSYEQGLAINPQNARLRAAVEKAKKMQKIDVYFKQGVEFYRNNDFNNGISQFKKALEMDPSFARGFYMTGRCLDAKKWHRAAMVQYQEALKLEPFNRDFRHHFQLSSRKVDISKYYERGRELERAGSFELAMEQYQKAMTLEKDLSQDSGRILDRNFADAEKYMDSSDWDKSIEAAERILQIHPENLKAHAILAKAYMAKGQVSKAVDVYKTMAKLDPENAVKMNQEDKKLSIDETSADNKLNISIKPVQGR